tara:strand:- start:260 stop:457 length:198 start_codon:yes stop_codon:yes gene_type:complete
MNEEEKTIKIKLKKRHLEWIKKNYGKSKSGVTSLFEYGGIDIQEVHAMADLLYHINAAFEIEDDK